MYGKVGCKYWFDKTNIEQILYPNIDQTQIDRLSKSDVRDFTYEAGSALDYFGYEKF